jgi:hypothetical protein
LPFREKPAKLAPVSRLTRQEQLVLCGVIALLLVGWAVKAWRTAHPGPLREPAKATAVEDATTGF